ncbi:MAG: cytochrome c [Deltaproteobacteria bacterium]|nr:cytochrome c [Deltaproteobacteria bacterium]
MKVLQSLLIILLITGALSAWGAERKKSPTPLVPPEFPQSPFGFTKGDQRRGEMVYQQNGCGSCHMIEGKGGKIGPDLSRIGETRRLPEAYRQHLMSDHRPPVTLFDRDMEDLVAYLQSLKLLR